MKNLKKKLRVLVVEDDIFTGNFIRETLLSELYDPADTVCDEQSAIEAVVSEGADLALIDINLGEGGSGLNLAKILKEKYKIPFVFITAYDDEKTTDTAMSLSPLGYLLKPFDERDLKVTLKLAAGRISPGTERKSNLKHLDTVKIRSNLDILMKTEKVYLDSELNMSSLAIKLHITNHQLSEIFNHILKIGFYDYLNRLRLKESVALMKERPDWNLLRIALDAGFNSRTTFNKSFQRYLGQTPESFRSRISDFSDELTDSALSIDSDEKSEK